MKVNGDFQKDVEMSDKEIVLDESNRQQVSEIGAIEWMNIHKLKSRIRYYNEKRVRIIHNVINNIRYKGLDKS